ncbi:MAG: xanthine dehydrogenase family protein [Candidatus Dormibacteraeota bacterium]|uniref:Xanthine dehydrogenase family protein n=1 Tax=Candidatus Dormiibacter inghamiae TaxID=3127013 RepID=A0A934KJN9_9BACT|nr:xanthine dehydrogenase family protein [Candidatus Dormibacteraeota bacterium]MBJ7605136.1 xanthine dehydrogenase family protein [Candidatus Dormibacteraeota bacterium]
MPGYLADLRAPGALELAFVRSPFAHALIGKISGPAVTATELGVGDLRLGGHGVAPWPWPALARGEARFVGEAVAVVWAETRAEAEDLAESVEVEFEPLEPEAPRRLFERTIDAGAVDVCFQRAEHVLERTFSCARQTPLPLETRGVLAHFEAGRLTLWSSTQIPHILRRGVAQALELEETAIRVLVPEVGGGFGLKAHVFPEELVAAQLARRLGRPVRWIEDRRENLLASVHAHDNEVLMRAAFGADGRVLAVEADLRCDVGAYSVYPFSASLEPATAASAIFAAYDLQGLRVSARAVTSHRCPVGAYRGVGTNTAVYATERMLDLIAGHLGLDPLEVRRRNALRHLPCTTLGGRELDSGDYLELLRRVESVSGYEALRREQAEARRQGKLFGIGLALFNEHSGTGQSEYRSRGIEEVSGLDACRVRVTAEGRIVIHTSSVEIGQNHAPAYRRLTERMLGLEPGRVDIHEGDTDVCPPGTGAFVSRGAVGVLDAIAGALRLAGKQDLAPGTDVTCSIDPKQVFPSGAHLAVVEVDAVTFVPRLKRYLAVEDCGNVIDQRTVSEQIRGGVAMGAGKVLLEESAYGEDGQPLAATLLDYLVPVAADIPRIEIEHLVSPSPISAQGSKGVGEAGTIGAFGAVANAVADAVAPLGAELLELPYGPQRIFAAIQLATTSKQKKGRRLGG